jgi:RNA polymerase sigma factor (sigma-70 family)
LVAKIDAEDARALHAACLSASHSERRAGYRRLGSLLHDIAWRRVAGDPRLHHLAEESMQEALLTIWRALERGRGPDAPERFVAWAATIVVNKVREGIRRLEPRGAPGRTKRVALSRQRSLDAPAREGEATLGERLVDENATGGEAAFESVGVHAEMRELVADIVRVETVSEASRRVLLLGYIEGFDDADLAEHLGTTRANVHVIRSRDLAKLRAAVDFMARLRGLYGEPT